MKKLLKRWVPLFMALALVVGAVNNNYLTAQATGSDTQIGGGTAESSEADPVLPEGEETAAQSEDASVEAESTAPESAADVLGNNADASETDTDVSGNDAGSSLLAGTGEVALMALNAANVPVVQAANDTSAAGDYTYNFDQLTPGWSASGITNSVANGALTVSFPSQWSEIRWQIPAEIQGRVTGVTVNLSSGNASSLSIRARDSSGTELGGTSYGSASITIPSGDRANATTVGIANYASSAANFVIDSVTFAVEAKTIDKIYNFDQLTPGWSASGITNSVANGALTVSFPSQWSEIRWQIPAEIQGKVTDVTVNLSSGDASSLSIRARDSSGTELGGTSYGSASITIPSGDRANATTVGIANYASSAANFVIDSITFTVLDSGSSGNKTPSGDAGDKSYMASNASGGLAYNWCTKDNDSSSAMTYSFEGDNVCKLTFGSAYEEIKLKLPEEIDLTKCEAVTFAVSEQNGKLNFKIHDSVNYGNEISAFTKYDKEGETCYRYEIGSDRTEIIQYIGVQASGNGFATNCTFDGVMFEMKSDDSGDTPTPTPTDNLTKPVKEGNTGVALPAVSANMNSYYKSDGVTYTSDATSGVQTVTYPSGYNQIQFTLGSPVDLTQYNQVTFTVTGATKPVKFGLHYWSDETGTIDLWTSASAQPTADGYYTFELNPDLLGKGTTATTISVWSNGDAQTFAFHGVTLEKNPDKTFAETREETFTADQLTTSSADAAKANGAWTVNFSGQDQDVVFNLPASIDMGKCLGITLHITTVNGPVNLFISNDGNKLESYWNTHSANGVVADSSITATGAINQFGVQAGRENDAYVPGTSVTFSGITFLMSGPKLENPVVQNNTTTCSAGCFDFDNAEKDANVAVRPEMTADGNRVAAEIVTFKQAGLNLTIEIPATVDVKYLKSIALDFKTEQYISGQARGLFGGRFATAASGILSVAAAGGTPGVTVSLLNADKNVIASADSSNIISLSKYFTGAKYIRFTSTGPTKMTLNNVVFNTEVPIVLNGDFVDTDVNVWTTAAWSPSVVTAESAGSAIVGGVSTYGKITDRNSPYQCFAQDITARVTNGKIYKFSFWAKLSDTYKDADGSLREVTFSPYYFDENGKEQYGLVPGGTYKQSLTAGEWTYFEGTVTIPTNSTGFVIRIMEQGTNYGQGDCLKGEYYVTGVKMWETDKADPGAGNGGGGGGGGWYDPNFRVPTKESNYQIAYEAGNLEVSWASATTATVGSSTQINFKNNYDEARFKLPRPLDMSLCAFLQVKTSNQNVPIAIKLYKNGVEMQADYYNRIDSTYVFVPKFEGNIDAVGIMSLATPNPEGAAVTVDVLTFGFTEELPPYVPPSGIVWNGDFADEDLSDWYAAYWDNVTIKQETSKTPIYDDVRTYGTYSRRTSPYQCFAQDITDRVEQGETYTFSFWAKLSNDYKDAPPEQRVVQFSPYTEDKSGKADYNPRLEGTYSQTLEPGVWTYFEGTYKVTNENPISRVVIRILEQGTQYGQGDCVKGSYSVTGVKMAVYVPEPPSIDEDVPNLRDVTAEDFGSDFLMGTAMAIDEVDDIGVEMLVKKHFSAVTLGNELKPDALFGYSNGEHTPLQTITFNGQNMEVPTLNYTRAEELLDKILEWNEAQPDKPIKVRGHVLVWHAQTPEWFFREGYTVKQNADGTENYVTPEVMNQRLEWYIKTVLEHFTGEDSPYKDLFYGWDVVNEAVADSGVYRSDKINTKEQPGDSTHSSNSSWWAVYHNNEFIINAFKYANKYAPADLELYYNDYNDSEPNKVKGIALLLSDVLAEEGTRIDAMGMQCHYTLGHPTLANMEKAIRTYAEIVGEVQLTEFDLKAAGNIGTDEGLEKEYQDQAVRYHEIYELLKKLDAEDGIEIGGFTVWGTIDSHSWLQTSSSVGGGADGTMSQCPLLFDANYKVKPAFWAFADYSQVDPEWKEAEAEEVPEEKEPVEEPETPEEPSTEEELKTASVAAASPKKGNPIPIIIAVCVAVAAVGGGSAYAFLRKKKDGAGTGSKK